LEGRGLVQYYAEQALGPMFGIALSAGGGISAINSGHVERGIESMVPKAVKDMLRAVRYTNEGVVNWRGDALIDEVTELERFYQLIGFTPSRISEQYEQNRAIKGAEKRILLRRSLLLNRYALAVRLRDTQWRKEIDEDIRAFNKVNSSVAITNKTKLQSLSRRNEYSRRDSNGIIVSKRLDFLRDDLNFVGD
jgi:hypothetical protein